MHTNTEELLSYFEYGHLPPGLKVFSKPFGDLANELTHGQGLDGPEVTAGLRKLLEAKDCFVRAALPRLTTPTPAQARTPDTK